MEQFVCRVFQGGKVTIPKRLRELLEIGDGDYVRLGVMEVVKPKAEVKVKRGSLQVRGV
jgi:bifunctional DNA-binding transcriptional regulator/antitoxin component of YhaV-PrlF toxin-antitoxin module